MTETHENIIDQLFHLLQQLLLPNWSDLIALLPWVLIALLIPYLLYTWLQWRRGASRTRSRVPRRVIGGQPPPGVHMPGPSRWPFVVPIGAALLLFSFALAPTDAKGHPTAPFNPLLLIAGMIVTFVAVAGWLLEAMHEWRQTASGDHGGHAALAVAGASAAVLPIGGSGAGAHALVVAAPEPQAPREPPPGVHMPGPSPWPFFAPIAFTVIALGFIFSTVLLIAGIALGLITAAGWLMEAGHEYRTTEEVGHAVPVTRDPEKVWPRRLVPLFAGVIAIAILITLAPVGLSFLNGLTPASATPAAAAVPAVPEISASSAVSFDTGTLIVPAGRPFDLIFHNNQAGVPHNVQIADGPAVGTILHDGDVITGPATATYHEPALAQGDYYFLCKIHPNMHGTVQARPETGGGTGGPAASPGTAPSP